MIFQDPLKNRVLLRRFAKFFKKFVLKNLTGASGDRRLFGKRYKKVTPKLDKPNTRFPLFVGSRKIFKKAVHKT
ncbi:MAG TPA: hypothetical protein IAB15_01925 [Candidatus Ornithoclostridium faecigallinarum]|nr:hypothetical protein [Candidatus Ornithoclostridium faecigallinarum]